MLLTESRYQFSAKREERTGKLKLFLIITVLCVIVASVVYVVFFRGGKTSKEVSQERTEVSEKAEEASLEELWKQKEFSKVNRICEEKLTEDPLNSQYLALNGFAYFYRGSSLYTLEDQIPLYDKALVNLRKVLILDNPPMGAEVHYILGKTYYHKGRFYVDQAVRHLEESVEFGYVGEDSYRYLGLAYSELGDYEKAVENFLTAAEQTPDSLLYLTIGQTYYKIKKV